jgi:hypothetical protein
MKNSTFLFFRTLLVSQKWSNKVPGRKSLFAQQLMLRKQQADAASKSVSESIGENSLEGMSCFGAVSQAGYLLDCVLLSY